MRSLVEFKEKVRQLPGMKPVFRFVREKRRVAGYKSALKSTLPSSISIELTSQCNIRCAKCPTQSADRPKGMMSEALYRKILADLREAGAPIRISLTGGGESIIHEHVTKFIKLARELPNCIEVGLATNGVGMTGELAKGVLDAGLTSLKFSLDAHDSASYFKLNRVDAYDAVLKNMKEFCRIKREGGYDCEVELKITLYKKDGEASKRLKDIWEGHVDSIRATTMHNWASLRGARKGPIRTASCDNLWYTMVILWNGQITLCCIDTVEGYFKMGNAEQVNLSKYWQQDPKLMEYRNIHLSGEFSNLKMCGSCDNDKYESFVVI